jgi:hypothetical protein
MPSLPSGFTLIRTGFLWGKPAILQSRDGVRWKAHSTHASVAIRNKRFYALTQQFIYE